MPEPIEVLRVFRFKFVRVGRSTDPASHCVGKAWEQIVVRRDAAQLRCNRLHRRAGTPIYRSAVLMGEGLRPMQWSPLL